MNSIERVVGRGESCGGGDVWAYESGWAMTADAVCIGGGFGRGDGKMKWGRSCVVGPLPGD